MIPKYQILHALLAHNQLLKLFKVFFVFVLLLLLIMKTLKLLVMDHKIWNQFNKYNTNNSSLILYFLEDVDIKMFLNNLDYVSILMVNY